MRTWTALGLAFALACAGCSKKKSPAPSEAPPLAPAQVAAPANDAAAKAPAAAAKPFDAANVASKLAKQSRTLNAAALELHKAKDYKAAIAEYIKSLDANPGNVLARYNLSCAYNLDGQRERGLAELAQLRRDDCRACSAQLLWAVKDSDWESGRSDKRFIELTSGIEVKPMTKKQAAKAVFRAFDNKDPARIADLVHPSRATRFRYTFGLCDDSEDECSSVTKAYGFDEFKAHMKKWTKIDATEDDESMVTFGVGDGIGTCTGNCCDYTIGSVTHGTLWLSQVCFHDKAGVLFISELEAADES